MGMEWVVGKVEAMESHMVAASSMEEDGEK